MLSSAAIRSCRRPATVRRLFGAASTTRCLSSSSAAAPPDSGSDDPQAFSSFSTEKMDSDKRYASKAEVPESLLQPFESEYSIRGKFREGRAAYLDMQATTPLDPRVLDAMLPYMIGSYGNPHSRTHAFGWESENVVEKARGQIASLIKADPKEIIYTSGATESNNLAIKGAAHFYKKRGNHVITTQTEHKW